MQDRPTRRGLLELSGTAAVIGLAGCTSLGSQPSEGADEDDPGNTEETSEDNHDEAEKTHDGDSEHHDEETTHEEDTHDGDSEHHDKETTHEEDTHDGDSEHHDEETAHEEDTHDGDGEHHDEETAHEKDEHGHDHDEGTPQEPSESAVVTLATAGQEYHYKPHLVWIEPGGTVTWRLESGSHDAVAYHPDNDKPLRMPEEAEPWNIELLSEEGTTAEHTFETEGVYDYYCTPHESLGMVGTVIVGNPDPHEQPALEDPQSSLPEGARTELGDLAENVNEILGHTH